MTTIKFSTDRLGRPLAFRWSARATRWIRIGLDEAKHMLSTGDAVEQTR